MTAVVVLHILMSIPGIDVLNAHAAVIQLHKPDAPLHQPPRHQALTPERLGHRIADTIKFSCRFRFVFDIHDLGRATLHAVGQFIGTDSGCQFGIARVLLGVPLVQLHQ